MHGTDWAQGVCGSRLRQSPVTFDRQLSTPPREVMDFHYEPIDGTFALVARGGMLTMDLSGSRYGGVVFNRRYFPLSELNVHGPAEHLLQGRRSPLEFQLVHRQMDDPKKYLVISFLVRCETAPTPPPAKQAAPPYQPPNALELDSNALLQPFVQAEPPSTEGAQVSVQLPRLELGELLADPADPDSGVYLSYPGSLTSPPCLDSAVWFVKRKPLLASNSQVRALADALYRLTDRAGSYRAIMPLNKRYVQVYRLQSAPYLVVPPDKGLPWGPNPGTDGEMEAAKMAKVARDKAEHAARYAEDLARRMSNADEAFARALYREPTAPPPKGSTDVEREIHYQQMVRNVRGAVRGAARGAQRAVDAAFRGHADSIHSEATEAGKKASEWAWQLSQPVPQ